MITREEMKDFFQSNDTEGHRIIIKNKKMTVFGLEIDRFNLSWT